MAYAAWHVKQPPLPVGSKVLSKKNAHVRWESRTFHGFLGICFWMFHQFNIFCQETQIAQKKHKKKHPCCVGVILGNPKFQRPVHFSPTDDRSDTNKPRAGNIMRQQIQILQFCTNSQLAVWGLYTPHAIDGILYLPHILHIYIYIHLPQKQTILNCR